MVKNDKSARWVLITGCSSGIGQTCAIALQERGYQVIASCRNTEDFSRLEKMGLRHVIELDLSSSMSIVRAVEQVLTLSDGQLFGLFNNGAYGLPGAVEDLSREALRRQFEVNVFGTHELTTRLLPHLMRQKDARIIQNSSVLGFVGAPNRGAYVASKFALEGLSDSLRMELRGTTVKCILIEPGPIQSRFRDNALRVFQNEIDVAHSRHREMYEQAMQRLQRTGKDSRFTLPSDAIVEPLLKALESPNPKARYRVTTPTHLMAILKRTLPTSWLDAFICRFASP